MKTVKESPIPTDFNLIRTTVFSPPFLEFPQAGTPCHVMTNLRDTPLPELVDSPRQQKFGADKSSTLPRYYPPAEIMSMPRTKGAGGYVG